MSIAHILRVASATLLALAVAYNVHVYLTRTLCEQPLTPSAGPLPSADDADQLLLREVLLRSGHFARVPLAAVCRSELQQLLLLLQPADALPPDTHRR